MSEEKNISGEEPKVDDKEPKEESLHQNEESFLPFIEPEFISNDLVEPSPILNIKTSEDMEVHHHGHVHEKKKWKEYVF